MSETVAYAQADGGICFVVGGVACPLDRESAIKLVDRLVERDAGLAARLAALLDESADPSGGA